MIPKEPGNYDLGKYFQWVFFNPARKQYDTLRSRQVVRVTGESRRNHSIESTDLGSFYDHIGGVDNTIVSTHQTGWFKIGANVLVVLVLGLSVYRAVRQKS
jgi:hypothetical protein